MKKIKFSVSLPVSVTIEAELIDDDVVDIKDVIDARVDLPTVLQLNECMTDEDNDYLVKLFKKTDEPEPGFLSRDVNRNRSNRKGK